MVGKQSIVFDVYETSSRFFKEVSIPPTNRSVNSSGYERFRKGQETVLLYFWPELSWSSCWLTLFHLVLFHLVSPLVPRKVQFEKTSDGWLSKLIYVLPLSSLATLVRRKVATCISCERTFWMVNPSKTPSGGTCQSRAWVHWIIFVFPETVFWIKLNSHGLSWPINWIYMVSWVW